MTFLSLPSKQGLASGLREDGGWEFCQLAAEILFCLSLPVPALQGGSTSEQASEKENLSYERRFLGSAFESFGSGWFGCSSACPD